MNKTLLAAVFCLGFASLSVNAETITLKLGEQGEEIRSELQLPERGQTMEQVEQQHGSPTSQDGPTGNPPITTWHYEKFSVYFEGNYVIHSVAKHMKKNQAQ